MKGLIIYKGKYGNTQQYAEWLSQDWDLAIRLPEQLTKYQLTAASYLLLVTTVSGRFQLWNWVRQNEERIRNKEILLFVVNTTEEEECRNKNIIDNVPASIQKSCKVYFLPNQLTFKKSLVL